MLHEERLNYETLKSLALDSYFDGCRDFAVMKGWSHEQIIGYVSYTFDEGFERPVEDLMWQVVLLVLSGGWLPTWEERALRNIAEGIEKNGLENLLANVPQEEAEVFKHDLRILKIISG